MNWPDILEKISDKVFTATSVPDNWDAFITRNAGLDLTGVIIGQDPYPYYSPVSKKPLATGIPFVADIVTPSLGILQSAIRVAIKRVYNLSVNVDKSLSILDFLGVATMNVAWSVKLHDAGSFLVPFTVDGRQYSYHDVSVAYLRELLDTKSLSTLPILALGKHAAAVQDEVQGQNTYKTIHPAAVKHGNMFNIAEVERFFNALPYGKENTKKYISASTGTIRRTNSDNS